MKLIGLLLVLAFSAQADELSSLQAEGLDLVHSFQRLHAQHLGRPSPSISLRMAKQKEFLFEDSISKCETYPKVVVTVAKDQWLGASPLAKELILFRSLGRCVLNRTRGKERIRNIPLSIMTPGLRVEDYRKYREEFIYELFKKNDLKVLEAIIND